ncbi:MAG: hypothetical protein Q7S39_11085 [Ignavibacteria bacterium]|nr:hypothetical protein [Ignavibacteria bacterium]
MKSRFKILLLLTFLFFISAEGIAQNEHLTIIVSDTIPINFDNHYKISHVSIIPFTETIILRDSLLSENDYTFSYNSGSFILSDTLPYSIYDTLIITYQALDIGLQKEYKKRSLVIKYDTETGDTIRITSQESGGFSPESIFGPGIEKSGTIIRGFTVGTTKDFSLNSGLRLQLSGRLSEDIEVVAALTDENTPIQPEGNTERLEELDKVFIQIKHPKAIGTFGDYQIQRRGSEFGIVDRKLQGLMGEFNFEDHNGFISVAGSRGKYNTNIFNGIEGVQGPYRISGQNNERDIIVIAGTERIYLDGILLKRGEANDYVIDYSNAQITFTPNKLITSASRITIDFEYTDRRFNRNFFGTGAESQFFDDKVLLRVQYLREGDDQDAPIDISLSEEDKAILYQAGDDRNKAAKSGVRLAEPDSLGIIRGTYIQVDTIFNNQPFIYYVYSPGDSSAIYNVSFSFVGEGLGDYTRESLGNYRFAGIGNGSYLPVIFLSLPELKQIGNIVLSIKPFEDVELNLEYAGSLWDKNRLSDLNDRDNYGQARNIFLKINPKEINIGSISFGKIGLSYKDRFIQDKFTSADRLNEIEFNRHYNVSSLQEPQDETLREIGLNLIPINELNISSTAGLLRRGDTFKSNRYNNIIRFTNIEDYAVNYNFDYVETENISLTSNWYRQTGNGYYNIWKFTPGVEFLAEDKKDKSADIDSLLSGSLKYSDVAPYLKLTDFYGLNLSIKYSLRDDYLPLNGIMYKESKSQTQFYELNYSGIQELNSTLNFTYREKKYTELFQQRGFLNTETILIRSQTRLKPLNAIDGDLFYEVSTQRSARLERVFVRVEAGIGNFRYLGDLNNNGIADENEFEPSLFEGDFIQVTIPTDELFPVIDLKTSSRWKIIYGELFDRASVLGTIFNPLSSETYWRIEENSREEDYKKIYFLKFSSFLNEEKTIAGSNYIQQDLFLWENKQELSFRFRYTQRKSLNQFSGGVEKGYNRERSLRIKFRMIEEMSNQTDLVNQDDNVYAPVGSNRRREISGNSITTDFSYRPERNIEVGFKLSTGRKEDTLPKNPTIIDLNSQTIRFNLSFAGTGRLRIEVERTELVTNTTENFLPFEITGGNQVGKNFFWRLNFDYRLSNNLQSTVSYDGRLQGSTRAIHTARAEVRAYF